MIRQERYNVNQNAIGNRTYRVNDQIRLSPLLVIGPDNQQLGQLTNEQAKFKARELGLDLVEVAAQARPPVCRIMDFSKFKYEQTIKEKKQKQNQKNNQLKEVRFKPNIEEHDIEIKVATIKKFLAQGNRVNLRLDFRGRANAHKELGHQVIAKILDNLKDCSKIATPPSSEGKTIHCVVEPLKI